MQIISTAFAALLVSSLTLSACQDSPETLAPNSRPEFEVQEALGFSQADLLAKDASLGRKELRLLADQIRTVKKELATYLRRLRKNDQEIAELMDQKKIKVRQNRLATDTRLAELSPRGKKLIEEELKLKKRYRQLGARSVAVSPPKRKVLLKRQQHVTKRLKKVSTEKRNLERKFKDDETLQRIATDTRSELERIDRMLDERLLAQGGKGAELVNLRNYLIELHQRAEEDARTRRKQARSRK